MGSSLSEAAIMDCGTAQALQVWVRTGLRPTVGEIGGGAQGLRVAGSYVCRTRNNARSAKISEHGKGRAIDISEIRLLDGAVLSVVRHWRDPRLGPVLRGMHAAACGPFGTVLGPNADAAHRDHFHFDTARHRKSAYCR